MLSILHAKGVEKNVVITFFREDALKKVRELDPNIETGLIYAKYKNPIKATLELKANYLFSFYRFTHTANVQKAHENGLKLVVWTINTSQEVEEYAKKDVEGIASDKSDILMSVNA